jgi:vacuolar-type H+-ATPase subunit I/STV1
MNWSSFSGFRGHGFLHVFLGGKKVQKNVKKSEKNVKKSEKNVEKSVKFWSNLGGLLGRFWGVFSTVLGSKTGPKRQISIKTGPEHKFLTKPGLGHEKDVWGCGFREKGSKS